ncbi:MAG: hypothetical protein H0Z35_05255 [Thermoanaerobacteraceae bacterium]|nr:hypothetical protein [Thermoanaerobacteraceae bacterium]
MPIIGSCQNPHRRFNGTDIFQEIFDEIVLQAIRKGLIDGKELVKAVAKDRLEHGKKPLL